jgi:hypothetical protein
VDCGTQGVQDTVSTERWRGIRIFDITDIANPKNIANVQTCLGSHTHTVVSDPKDSENVYIYVSGSAPVRSPNELPGCISAPPDSNPNSSLFRIEVIKIPLASPQDAKIVSSPRIFDSLVGPARHGETKEDSLAQVKAVAEAKAKGGFTAMVNGQEMVLPNGFVNGMLDSVVKARGTGAPTGADSAASRGHPRHRGKIVGPPPVPGAPKPADAVPTSRSTRRLDWPAAAVRRLRPPAGHPRCRQSEADLCGVRFELLLLALGDVQQRWHQAAVLR